MRRKEGIIGILGNDRGRKTLKRESFTFDTVYSTILVVFLVSCWYFTSSKNAIATQQLVEMDELKEHIQQDSSKASAMALLTSLQILVGAGLSIPLFITFSYIDSKSQSSSIKINKKSPRPETSIRKIVLAGLVGALHYFGSFFTNMGFMYGSATLVQVVKLLEPVETLIFMALVNIIFFRKSHGITSQKATGTFFVVGGALVLLLQKGIKTRENPISVVFALLSGLTLATRNVTQKSSKSAEIEKQPTSSRWQDKLLKGLENFISINVIAAVPSMLAVALIPGSREMVYSIWNAPGGFGMQAVFFHGMYNMASISVLSMVAVQTHSLLNVGKRITNVIVATIFFGIHLQISGIIGLFVALFGGFVYAGAFKDVEAKVHQGLYKNRAHAGFIIFLLFSTTCLSLLSKSGVVSSLSGFGEQSNGVESSILEEEGLLRTLDKTTMMKRHIVLLGPHERFNFGDLLFEKVVSKLLLTRLGYKDHEIIRAATVPRNMTIHGGYDKIVSMKQAQNMSRTSPFGPFDIIYTGGQTMTCKFRPAVNMLGDPELTAQGLEEQVYDCAYLFPKELLLPLNDEGEPDSTVKNIAVTNSVGGYPGRPECNKAVETADYNVYRDIAPLAPDCAVMVKELYGDLVAEHLKEVRQSLFPEDEDRKYIAVQFKKTFDVEHLPRMMDNIVRKTGCIIVFFAAGTAPGHDSFELYRNVTERMKEPAIVYEGENVWKTVAVISGAEAVFSSSLHVRIMAFIYLKPRVTWCPRTGSKHDNFINLWDAPNMRVCGEVNTTWSILNQYWGETPGITQEETEIYYKKTVVKYMESFRKWGGLLDLFNKIEKVE